MDEKINRLQSWAAKRLDPEFWIVGNTDRQRWPCPRGCGTPSRGTYR